MSEQDPIPGMPDEDVLHHVFDVLGPFNQLTYAPPNIYPMAAPAFSKADAVRPPCDGEPLGIYAHVPFCNYACSFCFYAKRVGDSRDTMEHYLRAVETELAWITPATPLTQLFVGGGTPTVLPADLLDRLLSAIFARVARGPVTQTHTVECSPESITDAHADVLVAHGIGRVSMGIQSTQDQVLDRLHRNHEGAAALEVLARLVARGLMVNVDLIYGLPGQRERDFRHDLALVAAGGAHSVTCYNLRVNERTPVARTLSDDDRLTPMRLTRWRAFVRHAAGELGYRQTRWHTFVRGAGHDAASRRAAAFEDITGQGNQYSVGLSARSRLGDVVYRNRSNLNDYIDCVEHGRSPVDEVFPLDEAGRKTRFIALTLGDGKPLSRVAYQRAFGRSFDDDFATPLRRLVDAELVSDGAHIALTPLGQLVHDRVLLAFYPHQVTDWLKEREAAAVVRGRLSLPVVD